MALLLRAGGILFGVTLLGTAGLAVVPGCYTAGGGTPPPTSTFYYPVGLAVSPGGNVLYAVNSDFDLQWNGGTLQSYDLWQLRRDTVALITANESDGGVSLPDLQFDPPIAPDAGACPGSGQTVSPNPNSGVGIVPGEECSPPVNSSAYIRDSAIIGAFATDLQLSAVEGVVTGTRMLSPVRGNATVTWAELTADDPNSVPNDSTFCQSTCNFAPFKLGCGARVNDACDSFHQAGNNPSQDPGDTRYVTMPGEPFGLAQTEDGTAMAVTHQTQTETSLLSTGIGATSDINNGNPSMQFVLQGMPNGGVGITPIPHDPDAGYARCEDNGNTEPCVGQAFLETSRSAAEIDLLRYYSDDGSSLHRPYIERERAYPITSNSNGSDSRGIVIDPTPRIACKAQATTPEQILQCAQLPARVFIANRAPASLIVAEIGESSANGDGSYDPDQLVITGNVPLTNGPSKVFLAPIVDSAGKYELRVFIVCFDTNTIFIYDPDAQAIENVVYTGPGPFAMAFDPFNLTDVANHAVVANDDRQDQQQPIHRYRFGYVASFTQSYVQILDLDDSTPNGPETFERFVFTLGKPTPPKGG